MSERLADSVGDTLRAVANDMFGNAGIRVIGENHVCVDLPQKHGPDMHIGCVLDPNDGTAALHFHELVGVAAEDLVLAREESGISRIPQGIRIDRINEKTGEKARFAFGVYLALDQF